METEKQEKIDLKIAWSVFIVISCAYATVMVPAKRSNRVMWPQTCSAECVAVYGKKWGLCTGLT